MIQVSHRYLEAAFLRGQRKLFWIVGSFPSVLVRKVIGTIDLRDVDFFYGAYHNRFWRILSSLLQKRGHEETLEYGWNNQKAIFQRQSILEILGFGITDLYSVIETKGKASDADIIPKTWNPYLKELLLLPIVLFATSQEVAKRLNVYAREVCRKALVAEVVCLPSPSPLSRRVGYSDEVLFQVYERIFQEHKII